MQSFEFDAKKSESNLQKHGIDFVDAQALWQDTDYVELTAKSDDEPRALVIGKIGGKHWSAITTQRKDKIRLISVRRSRDSEVTYYES